MLKRQAVGRVEIQQLSHDSRYAGNLLADNVGVVLSLDIVTYRALDQQQVVLYYPQRIVDFVGNLGRHFTQGRQALGVHQLLLSRSKLLGGFLFRVVQPRVFNGYRNLVAEDGEKFHIIPVKLPLGDLVGNEQKTAQACLVDQGNHQTGVKYL